MPDLFPHVKKWHSTRNSACFSRFFDFDAGWVKSRGRGKRNGRRWWKTHVLQKGLLQNKRVSLFCSVHPGCWYAPVVEDPGPSSSG